MSSANVTTVDNTVHNDNEIKTYRTIHTSAFVFNSFGFCHEDCFVSEL